MNKTYRQGQILRLIRRRKISTQEQLAHELASLGVNATQVTLSRDIRELGLVKTPDGYRQVGGGNRAPVIDTIAAEFLREVAAAQNLVVLKTSPGHASPLAIALDQQDWPEIVGTIAGDDTVLIVTQNSQTASRVQERLLEYMKV